MKTIEKTLSVVGNIAWLYFMSYYFLEVHNFARWYGMPNFIAIMCVWFLLIAFALYSFEAFED